MFQSSGESFTRLDEAPSTGVRSRGAGRSSTLLWKANMALAGVAVNLIIIVMFIIFFSAALSGIYRKAQDVTSEGSARPTEAVTSYRLFIDTLRVPPCPSEALRPVKAGQRAPSLPCLLSDGGFLTSEAALGPWTCDSARKGGRPCPVTAGPNSGGPAEGSIVAQKRGVYLIVAQTVLVDSLASPATLLVRVNDSIRAGCAINSTTASLVTCSVTTVTQLDCGDRVTLDLGHQAYRRLDPHGTLTYVDFVRLGEDASWLTDGRPTN